MKAMKSAKCGVDMHRIVFDLSPDLCFRQFNPVDTFEVKSISEFHLLIHLTDCQRIPR